MPKLPRFLPAVLLAATLATALLSVNYLSSAGQVDAPAGAQAQDQLRINELMADNKNTLVDPDEPGETPDWIELFNPGPGAVSLDGLGLADGLPLETGLAISNGLSIPEGGFLVFFADNDPGQGKLHTNFKLSNTDGESVILYNAVTKKIIDQIDFPALGTDVSYGRKPDGAESPAVLAVASPNASNALNPPRITDLTTPPYPAPADTGVSISATVTDTGSVATVTLHYSTTVGGPQSVAMAPVEANVYAANLPAQGAGTLVSYYVMAVDNDGESSRAPLAGRDYRYLSGYVAPVLLINEVVVENSNYFIDPDEPLETPDWIELYNPGPNAVSLDGLSLSDDNDNGLRFRIPNGLSIAAGALMTFLADDDVGQNTIRGNKPPIHLNFNLNKSDSFVGLYGGQGTVLIDSARIKNPPLLGAVGRIPDGAAWSAAPVCATFNEFNLLCDKAIYLPVSRR